jgi:hypothetical protein
MPEPLYVDDTQKKEGPFSLCPLYSDNQGIFKPKSVLLKRQERFPTPLWLDTHNAAYDKEGLFPGRELGSWQ